MVMGMANLAMVTGNIGREGVGVNPLRGQNNVQGSCDMGSFPHEFPGYRHVSRDDVRGIYEELWGPHAGPGARPADPQHVRLRPRRDVPRALRPGRGHRAVRPQHPARRGGAAAMDLVVVQDLFLNETARFAHVFLPGTSSWRRTGRSPTPSAASTGCARSSPAKVGKDEWQVACEIAQAMGYDMHYDCGRGDHGRDRRDHADLRRRLLRRGSTSEGSMQWPVNDAAPLGTPDDARRRVRPRQGPAGGDGLRADHRAHHPPLPADPDHRPHPHASTTSARRPGVPPTTPGTPRTCWRSTRPTPRCAGSRPATSSTCPAAWAARRCARRRLRADAGRASSTRPSTTRSPAPTWSRPRTPTGPPTARSTR